MPVPAKAECGGSRVLASTFMLRVLQPYHESLAKRQVKSPEVYPAGSLLHALLGITDLPSLEIHPLPWEQAVR